MAIEIGELRVQLAKVTAERDEARGVMTWAVDKLPEGHALTVAELREKVARMESAHHSHGRHCNSCAAVGPRPHVWFEIHEDRERVGAGPLWVADRGDGPIGCDSEGDARAYAGATPMEGE